MIVRRTRAAAGVVVTAAAVAMALVPVVALPSARAADVAPASRWSSLGGRISSGPSVVSWGPGREDVFARGSNGVLWHRADTTSGWGRWQQLGGRLASDPAAASYGPGELDVFARGTDGKLWHRWYPATPRPSDAGRWSAWQRLAGPKNEPILGSPAAVVADNTPYGPLSLGTPRLVLFVRGRDGHLWWKAQQGDWLPFGPWHRVSTRLHSDPDAALWQPGDYYGDRIDVFSRNAKHAVQRQVFTWRASGDLGAPARPQSLGGRWPAAPAATSYDYYGYRNEDVFVRGKDGRLYWKAWHPSASMSWTRWRPVGGAFPSSAPATAYPGGVAQTSDRRPGVDVFMRGRDHRLWYRNLRAG